MPNSTRGFAAMDPEQQRRIASKGGRAAHQSGHAHEWDSEEAAEAGRRGGLASHGERAAFHHDTAAHHHTQAARFRASGEHERADLHAEQARHHGRQADDYGDRARSTSSGSNRGLASMDPGGPSEGQDEEYQTSSRNGGARGGSREQHQEAGRRGAEARWSREKESEEDSDEDRS